MESITNPIFHLPTEMSLIGACLFDWNRSKKILINSGIEESSFYDVRTKAFYKAIMHVDKANNFVDSTTITQCIQEGADLLTMDDNSLLKYANDCIDLGTVHNLPTYCAIMKKLECKRNAQTAMVKALKQLKGKDGCETILPGLSKELRHIYSSQLLTSKDEIARQIKEEVKHSQKHGYRGVPSRWDALQRKLGGYAKGKNIILAARPSVGKTTFALNEMRGTASGRVVRSTGVVIQPQIPVAMISLETSEKECYQIIAAERAAVDLRKIYDGEATTEERDRLDESVDFVLKLPIFITDTRMDIYGIESWLAAMKDQHEIEMCWLDYAQIIKPAWDEGRMKDRERISGYSKSLFYKADELDISIGLLAQINRDGEMPPNISSNNVWKYIPRLKHLKDTGALEEDAYQGIVLYPDPEDPSAYDATRSGLYVHVQKNKRGPKGKIPMEYLKDMQRITDGSERKLL